MAGVFGPLCLNRPICLKSGKNGPLCLDFDLSAGDSPQKGQKPGREVHFSTFQAERSVQAERSKHAGNVLLGRLREQLI